jgi:hypothetical protein
MRGHDSNTFRFRAESGRRGDGDDLIRPRYGSAQYLRSELLAPRYLRIALPLLLLSLAGCGSQNGLNLGRVSGKVTYKGEPVRNGTVMFMPDESKGTQGPPAMGVLGTDGAYVMTTDQTGDGAIVGIHKVGIMALGTTPLNPDEAEVKEKDEVKAFFANKSALATRKPSGERAKGSSAGTYRDRRGRVFAIVVPENLTRPTESGISVKVENGSNTVNIVIQENGTALVEK